MKVSLIQGHKYKAPNDNRVHDRNNSLKTKLTPLLQGGEQSKVFTKLNLV